jgi:hypothetical protein
MSFWWAQLRFREEEFHLILEIEGESSPPSAAQRRGKIITIRGIAVPKVAAAQP